MQQSKFGLPVTATGCPRHNKINNKDKLEHYGVGRTANKCIVNYLKGRQQYAWIENVHSGYKEVIHCIPPDQYYDQDYLLLLLMTCAMYLHL